MANRVLTAGLVRDTRALTVLVSDYGWTLSHTSNGPVEHHKGV